MVFLNSSVYFGLLLFVDICNSPSSFLLVYYSTISFILVHFFSIYPDAYLATQKVPKWAEEELQEAIDRGITDGTNPTRLIPRYQAAILALRAAKGKK